VRLSLATLESLASDGGYSIDTSLSDASVVLILMLLQHAGNLNNWDGYDVPLSASDIDTIDEIVGNLSNEVMS